MANRYWVGGTGIWNTTSTTNWSATSGGSGGASVPTAADSVFFNQATTYTVTMTGALACLDITVSAGTVTFATGTTPTLAVSGSFSIVAATTWDATGVISFIATSLKTITTNGSTISAPITFNGIGGTWQLQDALRVVTTRTTTLTNGTLDLNNFTLTTGLFNTSNTNTRTIAFGTGNITLIGSGTVWQMNSITGFSRTGTPTVNVSNNTAIATTVATGLLVEATSLDFNFTTGTYSLTFTGNCRSLDLTGFAGTFPNVARTIYGSFNAGTTATLTAGTAIQTFSGLSVVNKITTNGRTLAFPFTFNGGGGGYGTWQLQDALTFTNTITTTLINGTLDLNNFTLTTGLFNSNTTNTRTIAFGTGNITVIGALSTVWNMTTSIGFSRTGTPTVNIANNSNSTITVAAGTTITEAQALDFNFTTGDYTSLTFTGNCRNVNLTGFTGLFPNAARIIYGSLNTGTAIVNGGTTITTFAATSGINTITTNGQPFDFPVTFNGVGGTWQLQDTLTIGTTRTFTLSNGTFDASIYNVTCGLVQSSGTGVRTLLMGSGTWTVTSSGNAWDFSTSTNATVTGTGKISLTSPSAKTFAGGNIQTWPTLDQGGTGSLTIGGSNKFANITNTALGPVRFTGGTTNEFTAFNLNGTSTGTRLTLGSTSTTQAILKKPTAWNVGTGSLNSGNNTGLSFTVGGNDFLAISYINGQVVTAPVVTYSGNFFAFF